MRLQNYINERYFTSKLLKYTNRKDQYVEIFINPTKAELSKMKYVRFIADGKRKLVYAWDGYDVIHTDVWDGFLKKELKDKRKITHTTLLPASAKNGRFETNDEKWEPLNHVDMDEVFYDNGNYWRWLESYFEGVNAFADWVESNAH